MGLNFVESELVTTEPSESCHRRKIKCVVGDASTCESCATAGLACTYNAIPQKKGPRRGNARVLTELRNEQGNASLGSGSLQEFHDSISLPRNMRTPGLITPVLLEQCVGFFFTSIYPLQPVLHWRHVNEAIVNMNVSPEACSIVLTLCAYTMIQTDTEVLFGPDERSKTVHSGRALLQESCCLQGVHDYRQNPTHRTTLASWFSYECYLELGEPNAAWCHLREATTQALLLGMHDEKRYSLDDRDAPPEHILYWLLFIAER